jgi:AcrR family transcriptional regulator
MPTPPRTSLDEIVRAARSLVEADGPEALTMSRVADAVGVRAPSLYKRVQGRDELLRLVTEDAVRELTHVLDSVTSGTDPARDLERMADAVRGFARRSPRAYVLVFAPASDAWRPDAASLGRATGSLLRTTEALAGPDAALEAARTVVAWLHGFLTMELAGAFRLGGDVDRAFRYGIERLTAAIMREAPQQD